VGVAVVLDGNGNVEVVDHSRRLATIPSRNYRSWSQQGTGSRRPATGNASRAAFGRASPSHAPRTLPVARCLVPVPC